MARSGRNELLRIVSDDVRLTLAWAIWSKMAQLGGLSTREAIVREYLLYVGGAWIRGGAGTMPATSPSTGERFAEVAVADLDDVDRAVEAARFAAAGWAALSAFERVACCESLAGSVRLHRDKLARALAQDQGKPLFAEAYGEVDELSEYLHMAAEDAKRLEGVLPPSTSAEARVLVSRVPLGVVGVVSPWNWPYTMGAEVFAPALAAGNTVVWVPAPTTAACSGLLAEVIAEGGLPPGVFNFLPGPGPVVGDGVVSHPGVDAVGFIGSVATGRKVARRCRRQDAGPGARRERADGRARGRRPRPRHRGGAGGCLHVRRPELHSRRTLPRACLGAGRVRRTRRGGDRRAGPSRRPLRRLDDDGAPQQRRERF